MKVSHSIIWVVLVSTLFVCDRFAAISESQAVSKPDASQAKTSSAQADDNFAREWKRRYALTLSQLEANRRAWKERDISDYKFVVTKTGAGGVTNTWDRLPVVITVQNGIRTSIEKKSKKYDYVIYSRTDGFEDFDSVDKLFDYLRRELESGRMLDVRYDKKLGYPSRIDIGLSYHVHGGRSIEISGFELVK